ncbi:hypothetical protein CR513_09731, partial [Mucuna pruriens]
MERRQNRPLRKSTKGYYWLTLKRDYLAFMKNCDKCQRYANQHKPPLPKQLHSISSPWVFHMWGVDILEPFPLAVE